MKTKKIRSFNELKNHLSERDIEEIVSILGYRCRIRTINKLRSNLKYGRHLIPNYGILERLTKDEGGESYGWSYCAGQSYPDEIRTIRDIILLK